MLTAAVVIVLLCATIYASAREPEKTESTAYTLSEIVVRDRAISIIRADGEVRWRKYSVV